MTGLPVKQYFALRKTGKSHPMTSALSTTVTNDDANRITGFKGADSPMVIVIAQ